MKFEDIKAYRDFVSEFHNPDWSCFYDDLGNRYLRHEVSKYFIFRANYIKNNILSFR